MTFRLAKECELAFAQIPLHLVFLNFLLSNEVKQLETVCVTRSIFNYCLWGLCSRRVLSAEFFVACLQDNQNHQFMASIHERIITFHSRLLVTVMCILWTLTMFTLYDLLYPVLFTFVIITVICGCERLRFQQISKVLQNYRVKGEHIEWAHWYDLPLKGDVTGSFAWI